VAFAILDLAKLDELLNDSRGDLLFQEFLVVVDERDDGVFGADVVGLASRHGMVEVKVDPLAHVQLVLIVDLSDAFDGIVRFLAHFSNDVTLLHPFEIKVSL